MMTREEQLVFCEKCLNRKMDINQGLICSITNQKATFDNECNDFKLDESFKKTNYDDIGSIRTNVSNNKISPEIFEKLKNEQNLKSGILSGLVAGMIGAILWGAITVATNFQIGYMAIAIGAGVGFTVRKFGDGIDQIFGIWGAIIALFSVILGNFFSIIGFIGNELNLGFFETLFLFDYSYLPDVMYESFNVIDLLFYVIAMYEGYRFSFRIITEKTLVNLNESNR